MDILNLIAEWLPKVTVIISACALIATVTPSTSDDRIIQIILDILNKLALNFGKAKNADDK